MRFSTCAAAAVAVAFFAPGVAIAQQTEQQSQQQQQPTTQQKSTQQQTTQQQKAPQQTPLVAPVEVTAGELADHPDRYLGKRVRIHAEVEDIFGVGIFALDEDKIFSTGRDVLVVNPRPDAVVMEDAMVTVTGTVRPFVQTEISRDYNFVLPDGVVVRYEGRPAILADSIRTTFGAELVQRESEERRTDTARRGERPADAAQRDERTAEPREEAMTGRRDEGEIRQRDEAGTTGTTLPDSADMPMTVTDIADIDIAAERNAMVGRKVDLASVNVQRLVGPRTMWVGTASGVDLFVVADAPTLQAITTERAELSAGQSIVLQGELRKLPTGDEAVKVKDWGVPEQDAQRLSNERVYVLARLVTVRGR